MTQAGGSPQDKLRVLIADDIQETRRNTRLMLSMIETVEVVAIASNGLQAVEMAKERQPDILVLDINMPEMSGLDAFREIQQFSPEAGCIIISAQRESEILHEAMSIGVREYLFKPFTIDQLEQAVKKVSVRLKAKRHENRQKYKKQVYLEQLANEYAKDRRSDDQAVEVYEYLAANLNCKLRWLRTLAMVYVIRQEWGKLKKLAVRLEQLKK
jgi:YesN/AraC family two-component response regulator